MKLILWYRDLATICEVFNIKKYKEFLKKPLTNAHNRVIINKCLMR
ncbi:hypothetical protein [uncultured Fenollaria sp.]|nr:hypothetical protein [uncultured Fenollaria sp.]